MRQVRNLNAALLVKCIDCILALPKAAPRNGNFYDVREIAVDAFLGGVATVFFVGLALSIPAGTRTVQTPNAVYNSFIARISNLCRAPQLLTQMGDNRKHCHTCNYLLTVCAQLDVRPGRLSLADGTVLALTIRRGTAGGLMLRARP